MTLLKPLAPHHNLSAPTHGHHTRTSIFSRLRTMKGQPRAKDGPVRATVRKFDETEQAEPPPIKSAKKDERRRGKSPGSKSSRTR